MTDDVIVIGGGIAGLAAAAYVARAGARVRVLEGAKELGGRARTTEVGEVRFNLGPHALYRGGPAWSVLADLGVKVAGRVPSAVGGRVVRAGVAHAMPTGLASLLGTSALPWGTKLDGLRAFGALTRADPAALRSTSVRAWVEGAARTVEGRELLLMFLRLASYSADPEQSAGAALAQLHLAVKHEVLYLDGGWASLVSALRRAAEAAVVETGAAVRSVEHEGPTRAVVLADGRRLEARAVVIATAPRVARDLLSGAAREALDAVARAAVPVEAACLDLALRRPATRGPGLVLGLDRPLYFSVHSRAARLGPDGVDVVQVAKYLGRDEHGPEAARAAEAELEALLDLASPGWRERVVERRFLPRIVVAQDTPLASRGGLAGRPTPAVAGAPGVFVVGDWVGAEGLLADATLASARSAARLALGDLPVPTRGRVSVVDSVEV